MNSMLHEEYNNLAHLVAEAHGLYLRLRDRLVTEEGFDPVVKHAYERYRRRVTYLTTHRGARFM